MQVVKACDLVTRYDNEYSLTTTNGKNAGALQRSDEDLLQVFPTAGLSKLIDAHIDAAQYLQERGLRPRQLQSENYRQWFIDALLRAGKSLRSPLAPLKILYGMVTNYKDRFEKPIWEQDRVKTLHINT
jgi:hypothetical protein